MAKPKETLQSVSKRLAALEIAVDTTVPSERVAALEDREKNFNIWVDTMIRRVCALENSSAEVGVRVMNLADYALRVERRLSGYPATWAVLLLTFAVGLPMLWFVMRLDYRIAVLERGRSTQHVAVDNKIPATSPAPIVEEKPVTAPPVASSVEVTYLKPCWTEVIGPEGKVLFNGRIVPGGYSVVYPPPVEVRSGCPGYVRYQVNGGLTSPKNQSHLPEKSEVVTLPETK